MRIFQEKFPIKKPPVFQGRKFRVATPIDVSPRGEKRPLVCAVRGAGPAAHRRPLPGGSRGTGPLPRTIRQLSAWALPRHSRSTRYAAIIPPNGPKCKAYFPAGQGSRMNEHIRGRGLLLPQPQSAQVLRTLLVSADLTAHEISATGGHGRFVPLYP